MFHCKGVRIWRPMVEVFGQRRGICWHRKKRLLRPTCTWRKRWELFGLHCDSRCALAILHLNLVSSKDAFVDVPISLAELTIARIRSQSRLARRQQGIFLKISTRIWRTRLVRTLSSFSIVSSWNQVTLTLLFQDHAIFTLFRRFAMQPPTESESSARSSSNLLTINTQPLLSALCLTLFIC
jgi:hypothetical protein